MLLSDILVFNAGPNSTRINDKYQSDTFYNILDLNNDLAQISSNNVGTVSEIDEPFCTRTGDLIISVIKEKACVVGEGNAGKCLTSAFIRCDYDKDKVDPWFICFYINESDSFKMEKHMRTGMSGLKYLHITSEMIGQVPIDLPPLKKQRVLGKIYKNALRQVYLYDSKKEKLTRSLNSIINNEIKQKGE